MRDQIIHSKIKFDMVAIIIGYVREKKKTMIYFHILKVKSNSNW